MSDAPPKTLSSRSQTLSKLQPVEPPQGTTKRDRPNPGGCRRPRAPRRQKDRHFRAWKRKTGSPELFYWHPCRASASPLSARKVQCTNSARSRGLFRHFVGTFEGPARHADRTFPARHSPEHRDDSAALRLPRRGRPHHRAGRFPTSDKTFRRAGMDYLDQVSLRRHDSWSKFEQWRRGLGHRLAAVHHQGGRFLP